VNAAAVSTQRNPICQMSRTRLPNRRVAETFDLEVAGLRYMATVGRCDDGRPAEVFLQNSKPGSASDTYMRDAAVCASLALQFGCPLEILQRALLARPAWRAIDAAGRRARPGR